MRGPNGMKLRKGMLSLILNYRETLRENNDSLERLGWTPTDRLNKYISEL